jgi:LacI family transcriptional regulator
MKQSINTIKNIAFKLGISPSTVSRVLNGKSSKYRISEKTSALINKTAKELNYSPNLLARGLKLNKTETIGIVVPDIANSFFSKIADNIEKYARKKKYSVVICNSEEDTLVEKQSVQMLVARKIDGLIISPVGQEINHILDVKKRNIPIILIDRYFEGNEIPFVTSDNFKGAYSAVNYLIENGHEKIACIRGTNTLPIMERVRGYKAALNEANITIDDSLIVGDSFSEQNGYIETKLLLKHTKKPTAILGLSNLISFGSMRALLEEGCSIPGDMSIITFDELPYLNYLSTPMTAVQQEVGEIGDIATKMLIDFIESEADLAPQGVFLPTKLIIRHSVKNIKKRE